MRKTLAAVTVLCLLATALATSAMAAATTERYLHIKVDDPSKGESVNVNVPLTMALKILPTVNKGSLHQGRVTISQADINGVDVRGLLDAIRSAPDNEFVTVKNQESNVRIAKSNGSLVVHVINGDKDGEKVDITIPLKIVDALFSTAKENELDVAAALNALSEAGDTFLVTVQDATQHVRIWVDSQTGSQ